MTGKIVGNKYFVDGKPVSKKKFHRLFPDILSNGKGTGLCGWKPLLSDALAINPSQIEEAQASDKKLGVPTEYVVDHDENGHVCGARPKFISREHRRRYMQAYGFFDKQGGYGDAMPGSTKRDRPDGPNYQEMY